MNNDHHSRRITLLKRLATLCVVLVVSVIACSAFIRLTNAGLGCDDWPHCYGNSLRQAQQGLTTTVVISPTVAAVRMLHRITAVAVLVIVLLMLGVCFTDRPRLWREGRLALALLFLALFLAVLGRWSSGARVPAVAIGNLLGGFSMLALAWRLRQEATTSLPPGSSALASPWVAIGVAIGLLFMLLQIALGGLVSASYSGLSCAGFPACNGNLWPTDLAWETFNPWHEPLLLAAAVPNPAGAAAHMAHRYAALFLLLALIPLGVSKLKSGSPRVGALLLILIVLECALGVLMVTSGLPLWAELAHNLGAALLLTVLISVF